MLLTAITRITPGAGPSDRVLRWLRSADNHRGALHWLTLTDVVVRASLVTALARQLRSARPELERRLSGGTRDYVGGLPTVERDIPQPQQVVFGGGHDPDPVRRPRTADHPIAVAGQDVSVVPLAAPEIRRVSTRFVS